MVVPSLSAMLAQTEKTGRATLEKLVCDSSPFEGSSLHFVGTGYIESIKVKKVFNT